MFRIFLMLGLCFASTALLAEEAMYGSKMNTQERILQLPDDAGRWYVTILGDSDEITTWFDTHAGLKNLKAQAHFNVYPTTSLEYQQKYQRPGKLCVRVQNHKGVIVSEFWDEYLPMTPDALYEGIRGDIQDKTSWGCPLRRRQPTPTPEPAPISPPIAPDIIPVKPDLKPMGTIQKAADTAILIGLGVLATLAGGGIALAQSVIKEHSQKS